MKKIMLILGLVLMTVASAQASVAKFIRPVHRAPETAAEAWRATEIEDFYYNAGDWASADVRHRVFDADGRLTEEVALVEKDGVYCNYSRLTNTYSADMPSMVALCEVRMWDESTGDWSAELADGSYRYTVERDANDNLKKLVKENFDAEARAWVGEIMVELAWNASRQPKELSLSQFDEGAWTNVLKLTNITWVKFNISDLEMADLDNIVSLLLGNNELKSATVNISGISIGTLSMAHDPNYDIYATVKMLGFEVAYIKVKFTDDYNSCDILSYISLTGEYSKTVMKFDDHYNSVLEENYTGSSLNNLTLDSGTKYEYTYDEHGVAIEIVESDYSTDALLYEPVWRQVCSGIIDVAGIQQPIAGEAVEVARYNIQGMRLDRPVQGLNIIVYSNGTARKVFSF